MSKLRTRALVVKVYQAVYAGSLSLMQGDLLRKHWKGISGSRLPGIQKRALTLRDAERSRSDEDKAQIKK
jgi:hypothetical protein